MGLFTIDVDLEIVFGKMAFCICQYNFADRLKYFLGRSVIVRVSSYR
jgi:hypothetical protein